MRTASHRPRILDHGYLYVKNSVLSSQKDTLEKSKEELQSALDEIRVLKGILPLCSFCKKIRNDKGYWEQVDVYIHKYSEADISHSICPECMRKHYPEEYEKI